MAEAGIYVSRLFGGTRAWLQLGKGALPVDTTPPTAPNPTVTAASSSSLTISWPSATDVETGIGGYEVRIDGGPWTQVPATQLSYVFTGLAASSAHTMAVRARDQAQPAANYSSAGTTSGSTSAAPVTIPQNVRVTDRTQTDRLSFAWDAPAAVPSGTSLSRYEWRLNQAGSYSSNTTDLTKVVTGLATNTLYTFGVRAVFSDATASAEVLVSARTSGGVVAITTLMGVSTTPSSTHGGLTWDVWRAYTLSTLNSDAAKTPQPKIIAYSEGGNPLAGSYATILAHCRTTLDNFYYNGTGQTPSVRAPIKLYWSNGNENYKAGKIPDQAAYVESMRALYDACHYIDPVTGKRRYPNAYAGSDPTTFQEQQGLVQGPLHASARYHDFVMWSNYSPTGTPADGAAIQYVWPLTGPINPTQEQMDGATGWLLRCIYRTKQAEAQARIDRGDPTFRLQYGVGEIGVNRSPGDSTLRPYYTVHAFWGGLQKLASLFDLDFPFACWWDDGTNAQFAFDNTSANPSTAQVWRNPQQYNHEFGGTHPAGWAGNPKSPWNTLGPVS